MILNGDFSSGFDYWDNGVGGEAYTLDAGQAKGASHSTSTIARTYQMLQDFNLTGAVATGAITVWCKWLAYYGDISHGSNRFIVKLQKPDTNYVTLLDTTKTGISGNGNLLNGVNIKAHLTQSGTYWLYLTLTTQASMSDNPDPPPTYSYGASSGWYDNIAIDIAYPAAYSITAEGGNYTETGQAVSLLKSSLLGIGVGTYTETGQTASLLKDSKIPIGTGSYTLTGKVASLLRSIRISAIAGSYNITGKAVNLRYSLVPPEPEEVEGDQKSFTTFKSELLWALGGLASADVNSQEGNWINVAYLDFCSKNKFLRFEVPQTFDFPELNTTTTETGNDGDAYIPKPSDGLLVYAVWDMTNDNELSYKDHSWYVAQAGRADASCEARPSCWIPYGDKLYLYPTLNAEYNFRIYYRKRPALLTGTNTTVIGAEWDEPILMLAVIRGFMLLRDFEKAKEWRERFVTTVQGLMGMQIRQARYTRDRLIPPSQHTQKHGY